MAFVPGGGWEVSANWDHPIQKKTSFFFFEGALNFEIISLILSWSKNSFEAMLSCLIHVPDKKNPPPRRFLQYTVVQSTKRIPGRNFYHFWLKMSIFRKKNSKSQNLTCCERRFRPKWIFNITSSLNLFYMILAPNFSILKKPFFQKHWGRSSDFCRNMKVETIIQTKQNGFFKQTISSIQNGTESHWSFENHVFELTQIKVIA